MVISKSDSELFEKIKSKQAEIKRIREAVISTSIGEFTVQDAGWSDIKTSNVKQRLCCLDMYSNDVTCCNVLFEKDGYIEPHTHENEEIIFCADGQYYDPVNKIILRPGDTQKIPPGKLHAGKSNNCLLFVTWRPAYSTYEAVRYKLNETE